MKVFNCWFPQGLFGPMKLGALAIFRTGRPDWSVRRELVLAKLTLLMKLGRSLLSAMRGTREVCDQTCGGRSLGSPRPRQSQLSVFFVQ